MSDSIDVDPIVCPHGERRYKCKEQSCIDEMIRLEEAATCRHGVLIGCLHCKAEANQNHGK